MTKDEISNAQRAINDAGIGPVIEDGIYGAETAAAYRELLRLSEFGGESQPMPSPPAPKPWWTSRAVLGTLSAILASGLGLMGLSLDTGQMTEILVTLTTLVSSGIALYGSINRTAPIDPSLVAPGVRLRRDALPPVPDAPDSDGRALGPFFDQ